MKKEFFHGDKLNDLIIECTKFVVKVDPSEFHVFTFKRLSCRDINPLFMVMLIYKLKEVRH